MHKQDIVHRHLKLENVMIDKVDNGEVVCKLTEFGLSSIWEPGNIPLELAGSTLYKAPEMALGIEQDTKVDIWALGVVAYSVLLGDFPFNVDENELDPKRRLEKLENAITDEEPNYSQIRAWYGHETPQT